MIRTACYVSGFVEGAVGIFGAAGFAVADRGAGNGTFGISAKEIRIYEIFEP